MENCQTLKFCCSSLGSLFAADLFSLVNYWNRDAVMMCHLIVQHYVKRKYMFMLFAHKFEVFVYASLVFAFYLRLCHVFFFFFAICS